MTRPTPTPLPAPEPAGAERRRHRRYSGAWSIEVSTVRGTWACALLDVSAGGAKLFMTAPVLVGEHIHVSSPRFGKFEAVVVWQGGSKVGVRFLDAAEEVAERLARSLRLPR